MLFSTLLNGKPLGSDQSEVIVPWWSFTKTVLAVAALSLVRDGLIELDASLPEGQFTLRQLLKHQAGLADYGELKEYHAAVAGGDVPWSAEEMMQRLDASQLHYAPGAGWRYSNVGYMFVGRLIERATGLGLGDALVERVFSPFGLSNVRLAKTPEDLLGVYLGSASTYHPGWVYHGLLVGPLNQTTVLLDQLLNGSFLSSFLQNEMLDAIVLGGPMPGRPWITPGYGLGLMIGGVNTGQTLIGHTGAGPGGVIAVYHCSNGTSTATCSVFSEGNDEGSVEMEASRRLLAAVQTMC